jgi:hypothetical protein
VRTGIWSEFDDELGGRATSEFASSYRRLLVTTRVVRPIMSDPSTVADVIAHAVTARAPRRATSSAAMSR